MAKDKEMTDMTSALLEQIETEVSMAATAAEVLSVSGKWWAEIIRRQGSQELIASIDKLAAKRVREFNILHGTNFPAILIEHGHYVAPTPRIGERVLWYQANDHTKIFAADVVKIEGVGRVQLCIIKAQNDTFRAQTHLLGVLHRGNPIHHAKANPQTVRSGSWDVLQGDPIPDSWYELAREEIKARAERTRKDIETRMARERAFRENEELAKKAEPLAAV